MGAAVGGYLVAAGHPVLWTSAGRSPGTGARAEAAGLRDAGTIAALSRQADIILSICPPAAALDVARSVAEPADSGFRGVFVDANAISPGTARDARAIDGGVGAASAVKMAYAAWTKGTAALILTVRALARAEGVEDILL